MLIGIIGWLLVGLIAGFIASKLVNLRGDEPGIGIAVASVAAVVGGWLYCAISGKPGRSLQHLEPVDRGLGRHHRADGLACGATPAQRASETAEGLVATPRRTRTWETQQ